MFVLPGQNTAFVFVLALFLLGGVRQNERAEAQEVENTEIEVLLNVVRGTFSKFRSSRIEYTNVSENGIETTNVVQVNANGIGNHFFYRSKDNKTFQFEQIFNAEGQEMSAYRVVFNGENPVRSKPNITGRTDWVSNQSDFDAAILFGFLWDGVSRQDFCSTDFWKTVRWANVGKDRLSGHLSNGGAIDIRFVQRNGRPHLAGVRIDFLLGEKPESDANNGSDFTNIYNSCQFETNEDAAITGWNSECLIGKKGEGDKKVACKNTIANHTGVADFPIRFDNLNVVNGTQVALMEDPGVEYEYFDGVFRKVIDKESIEQIEELLRQNQSDLDRKASEEKNGDNISKQTIVISSYLRTRSNIAH
jgi:hypothetical protein